MLIKAMSLLLNIKRAKNALNIGKIDLSLRIVHNIVELIQLEPMCTAQVFSSFKLDQLCMLIGARNLGKLTTQKVRLSSNLENCSPIVYVISRLLPSGGHSRLIQDFITAQPDSQHLILSTEVGGRSDIRYFSNVFKKQKNVFFYRAPNKNFEERLNWLQSILLSSQPEHVYLFNHHQDSVAVAAIIPELNLKGSFCHHGDHNLCLGVHLSHLKHIDFHPMGYHYCRDVLGIKNTYIPLTFKDNKYLDLNSNYIQGNGNLITATAARWNKIEVPYHVSYINIIPRILKTTNGKHIHIGKLTPWSLLQIKIQMKMQNIPNDNFVYIEWTCSVWKTLQKNKVDVYLTSFPYGAGLTLIEAMGAGIPVIMHEHLYSRVLCGIELAYSNAFRWSDPEKLLNHLYNLKPKKLKKEKSLSRAQYEKFHHPKILKSYFQDPSTFQIDVPNLIKDFSPHLDDWAYDVSQQLGFRYVLLKFLTRNLKKIKSIFQ